MAAITSLESKLDSGFQEVVKAIKTLPSGTTPAPSPLGGVNWGPIIQGLATGVAQAFGVQVSFPTTPSPTDAPAAATPTTQKPGEVQELRQEIKQLTDTVNTLAQTVTNLAQQPAQQAIPDVITQLFAKQDQRLIRLESMFTQFMQAQIRNSSNNGSNESGSTPPASPSSPAAPASPAGPASPNGGPTPLASPATMAMVQEHADNAGIPISYVSDDVIAARIKESESKFEAMIAREQANPPEITSVQPYEGKLDTDIIVTADLEAMILPDGKVRIKSTWPPGIITKSKRYSTSLNMI
jgi:ElaB/YqjD/DUF883 family membrane-anchored ribosome-binding protein